MRAWLLVVAALAVAPCRATAAQPHPDPARLDRIKSQILAKLGLTSRPTPLGAPPRDVVRQILARAADPHPHTPHTQDNEHAMREVIAIAHRDKCSIECKGAPQSEVFAAGQKYNYGVEGTVTVYLTGADKQETSVKLLGQVSVTATGNCGHELHVQNLVISGPDGKKYQSPPGIDKPIQFSLQDGRIGPEICAEDGDTRRSLNIKRAIISLLQTEQKSATQVDIFGACPTDITSSQEGGAVLIHRARDLSRCAHREQGRNELIASVLNPNAEIKESQILRSSLNVETKVNNNVPEKVSASEEYLYKPFSVGENGARAKVHTKLTLTGKAAGGPNSHCTVPRTIIFEAPHGDSTAPNNVNAALNAVKDTAKNLNQEADEKSAGKFAQIVRIFRSTSKDDLIKVFNQVKGVSLEKRVYLDALLRTGTGASIEASVQILKGQSLNNIEQQLVYLSLGNAKHVNAEALKAATSLLDLHNVPKEIYLGVGALAGAYCRQHQCHHVKADGIVQLSNKLAAKLHNCKPKNKQEEDYVVAVLKGIRNIRHLEDNLIDRLAACANDQHVKARVKAAALEAFHADPCAAKLKTTAINIMKNRNLDSEIRIQAYLAVIACPCGKSANEIKNLLNSEPVIQVSRYISSSLRAIRASSNPDKQLAKQHYGLISIPNRNNIDDRKYSFYRESSFNVDALGIGGSVEQSVIFSQDSFLPRYGTLNLTTEVFGHNFNVLEIGTRQGNLDLVVEHFLGPKGILKTQGAQALYDILVNQFAQSSDKVKNAVNRGRRSIKTEIDAFDKNLKAESVPFNNELDFDIFVKIFGTDAIFLSLGNDKGFDFNKAVDQFVGFLVNGIEQSKHLSQELRANLLFIDAELSYPTSTGLPLKLDLIGSATTRLDLSSNFDLRECIKNPKNAKIDIKFIPSSDIEISGIFLVDADAIATGLKVVTNLHTSTGGHLVAKVLENGHGVDIQLGLPVDKQEILVASNDLVYFTAEKGQKEKQIPIAVDGDKKEYSECFDQLSGLLGLTFCSEVSLPFSISGPDAQASITKYLARYPLTGHSRVKLVLEKNDLKGYHIRGIVKSEGGKDSFELLFDAEGSKNRRTQITGEKIYTDSEIGVKLALESPIKTASGEISYRRNPHELAALVKAKVDAQEYFGRIGFNIQGNEQRAVYKPIFEYQIPDEQGKKSVQIDGQVIRESRGPVTKYSFDGIKLNLPNQEPINIDGYFSNQQNPRNIEWEVISKLVTLKGNLKEKDLLLEFMNKLNPAINFRLKGHSDCGEVVKNEFDLVYSGDLNDQNRRVFASQFLKYNKPDKPENFNVITKNKLEILALQFKTSLDADIDTKKVELEFDFTNADQKANVIVKGRTHIKKPDDYSFKLNANVNKGGIEVFSKRDIINNDKSNFENYIVVKGVGKYELSGVVLHRMKTNDMNVGATGHLKISGSSKNEDFKFDIGSVETSALYSTHATITSNSGDIIDFLLKINRGANPKGQLKFVLKDAVSANGQFQVTDNDGKGNGMVIVDFKKSQRKIKADVKFVAKAPVFDGDFDIFLNFEKDNNDKICFKTNNKRTEKLIDSKNKLEYGGKTSEVNVHAEGDLSLKGKHKADVEVVLPTERFLSLKFDRDVTEKDDTINGHASIILSDAPKRGAGASIISYKGKLHNTNFDKNIVDYEGQVELKLKDGKQLVNNFNYKNVAQGEKFKFDFKSEVNGNILPKPATLTLSSDYIDSVTVVDSKYKAHASYGDQYAADVEGVWVVRLKDGADKKYLDDYTVTFRLPFEKAHDLKYVSTLLFLQPDGKDNAEYTIIQLVQVNADVYKIDANGKVSPRAGSGTVKLLVPHVDPVVLDATYKHDKKGDRIDNSVEVKARYGKGKTANIGVDTTVTPNGNDVVFKAHAPQNEKFKKLELSVHSKNPAPDTYSSSWVVDADGRVYKSESNIVLSKAHPVLDIKYSSPSNPKTSRLYVKGSSLSSTQGKVEMKVDNIRDISLDLVSEASIQKDNVNFKLNANSKELKWNNFVGEIVSKDAGSGKRLEFHFTNDNKNVLSGSTSFISKQEGQKTIIEGSGSVKIQNDQKSANFKYIRTTLTEGNEKGVETFFNIAFGERSYVAESRITNLEYKNSHVYCEEKKQCAHAEIQSKIDISKPGVIANIINAGFDLRKLGVAPELGLTVRDEVSGTKLPQYTLDLYANKDDRKYHLHVYNTPVYGNAKSGIKIQLPQRIIVLENSVSYPTDRPLPFPIKGELVLDLDKNKPGHKAAARFLVDLDVNSQERQSAVAEFGFSHPRIDREALVRISGAAFQLKDNTFKFETAALIAHSCLGNDREAKLLLEGSPTHLKFLINTPLVKVIDVDASATIKDKLQKLDLKFVLLEGKPVQVHALAKDFQYYEFTTAEADRKLSVVGHIVPEKRIDISADILLSGQKKNLVHGALWLDNNLVKSDYGASKDHCNYFLKAVQKDMTDLEARIKELGEKASKDLKEISNRVQPTLQKLEKAYSEDLKKMYQEIADDKVLKDISQAFHDIAVYVAKMIDDVIQATKPVIDELVKVYGNLNKRFIEMYEKQIEPQLKAIYETFGKALKEYLEGIIDLVAHFAAIFTDFFEKHKAELQELTNTFAEIFKDLTRLLVAQLKEVRGKLEEFFQQFTEWAKDLPIVAALKEKWSELAVPEQAIALVQQLHESIRPLLPTPELQQFSDALNEYVIKKLRKDKCDDAKELRVVYQRLVNAVASVIQFVRNQLNVYGVPNGPTFDSLSSWSPSVASSPTFGGSASWSVLRQLLNGDFPDVVELFRTYRPRSFNPLDELPAKLRGVVVNGQHIFTFDGRHLTFPGSCRYVLVHDHVDRNFTLLLQLQDGKPKALVLEDKSGSVIELKDNGHVTLNGANHGYPVHEKDSFAFREASGRIGLGTLYGLMAFCSPKLEVCYVEVNGFYLGKLRGLLGDGNNEPFDDFRLPNGKIGTSESEFGNAYRLAKSCAQVNAPAHHHDQMYAALPEPCEKVFGPSSSLRLLQLVLDIYPFRQACIHAVQSDPAHGLQQACDLARGYTALAVTGLIPATLPPACLQCTDADKPRDVADVYEVKVQNKQADIIVTFELTKINEKTVKELVIPYTQQVIDDLKKKGCVDIKVYLVGVTSEFPYPVIYDTDLKLKNKAEFNDESRFDKIKPLKTGVEKVDKAIESAVDILNRLRILFGLQNFNGAYSAIPQLPLRAGAVKHLVAVPGEACVAEDALPQAVHALIFDALLKETSTYAVFADTGDVTIGNGKDAKQIVGFTQRKVVVLGDKKLGKDSEALRKTLHVKDDNCIVFAEIADSYVFLSSNYFALGGAQQKQFIQTAANAVAQEMTSQTLVLECTCAYADPFRVKSVCVTKQRKEAARRRK